MFIYLLLSYLRYVIFFQLQTFEATDLTRLTNENFVILGASDVKYK